MKSIFKTILFALILFYAAPAFSFQPLNPPYAPSDPNFNKLAMRVYSSNSPYIYTYGAYTYNAIPITSTMFVCRLISIIRHTQGFSNPRYWEIENYKICNGNITDVENTNPAGWNNMPQGIKPVIDSAVREARQFGKATADYYRYRVIARTGAYIGTVFVYVLNGIKLEAMMRF